MSLWQNVVFLKPAQGSARDRMYSFIRLSRVICSRGCMQSGIDLPPYMSLVRGFLCFLHVDCMPRLVRAQVSSGGR
jgi:hypothetical protein